MSVEWKHESVEELRNEVRENSFVREKTKQVGKGKERTREGCYEEEKWNCEKGCSWVEQKRTIYISEPALVYQINLNQFSMYARQISTSFDTTIDAHN